MKSDTKSILLLVTLGAGAAGCVSENIEPQTGAFEEVTYTHASLSEPSAHRISLQYKNKEGRRVMVWPSLYGVRSVIKGDIAIFVGDQVRRNPSNNKLAPYPRLFAVEASGPPLDITDEVLRRWTLKSGEDFTNVVNTASIGYPQENGHGVDLFFARGFKDLVVQCDWSQIADIMQDVKQTGVIRKDQMWGATYIQKEYKLDVMK